MELGNILHDLHRMETSYTPSPCLRNIKGHNQDFDVINTANWYEFLEGIIGRNKFSSAMWVQLFRFLEHERASFGMSMAKCLYTTATTAVHENVVMCSCASRESLQHIQH